MKYIKQNLEATKKDPVRRDYAHITREDLLEVFGDTTILAIRNHDAVHRTGLLEGDQVILNRALLVSSNSALDCRLVSVTPKPQTASQSSEVSTDSAIVMKNGEEATNKRKASDDDVDVVAVKREKLNMDDEDLDAQLTASAEVVLANHDLKIKLKSAFFLFSQSSFL